MPVLDKKYKKHHIFKELSRYITFYEDLSMLISSHCTSGIKALQNLDSHVYSSIQGTLQSLRIVAKIGRMGDAYTLLRKYYDSVIINIYCTLYLEDNVSIDNFIVKQINNWVHGKVRLPEYRIMLQYIKNSRKLTIINDHCDKTKRYKHIRDRCNDYTHYNFFYNVLLNDNNIYMEDRVTVLDLLSKDTKHIFILHFAYIFFLKDYYMSSSDYMDALECWMSPIEDSQYWVAPFIQEIFDEIIKKERPDIADAIKQHSCMSLS